MNNEIKPDLKQQTFYNSINNYINTDDIIFSDAPQIANFYIRNKVYTLDRIDDFNNYSHNRYIIISREAFPNEIWRGEKKIKGLNIVRGYSIKNYYLYQIVKNK
ncbi:MAG: hypothetical protein IPJ03_18160 [Ignavibacteriales bacterium]|nr:hypothetical protein [Ignavibacteriales bacterium]